MPITEDLLAPVIRHVGPDEATKYEAQRDGAEERQVHHRVVLGLRLIAEAPADPILECTNNHSV